ncbi:MAG: putative thioredoxin [Candidatus Tokpelaia sp. JSC161]|jgi:putative thioredoxin|nr:MAG: putative thioredoxin [Candidatus Tokpelaia sp. JSC161]
MREERNLMNTFILDGKTTKGRDGSQLIKDVTTATFQKDVILASRKQAIVVDFWATWCEPCKKLLPILEKLVVEDKGLVLFKMNIDKYPVIARQLGIRSVPTLVAFVNGRPLDVLAGLCTESDIKKFIRKFSKKSDAAALEDRLKNLDRMVCQGEFVKASKHYAELLKHHPKSISALVGLATCLFEMGQVDKALAVLDHAPGEKSEDPRLKSVRVKIEISEESKGITDVVLLEKRVIQSRRDYQARFELALLYHAQDKKVAAADSLLDIIRADRHWNDDRAYKQLLKFFDCWGPGDEATLSARRKLSSLLFS